MFSAPSRVVLQWYETSCSLDRRERQEDGDLLLQADMQSKWTRARRRMKARRAYFESAAVTRSSVVERKGVSAAPVRVSIRRHVIAARATPAERLPVRAVLRPSRSQAGEISLALEVLRHRARAIVRGCLAAMLLSRIVLLQCSRSPRPGRRGE
jgi:hypothetical protein